MRVLFDVTHPAHVHLFRHAIRALAREGHAVAVAAREKDVTTSLLSSFDIEHTVLSRKGAGRFGMVREWGPRALRLYRFARVFDPDVTVSRLNPATAMVSSAVGCPSILFDDTEIAGTLGATAYPFADLVCTPAAFGRDVPARQLRYEGLHELAYLHPEWFDPRPERLRRHGVDPTATYSVLRLVAPTAHHDRGSATLSTAAREDLIARLREAGDLYITSEAPLPDGLEEYRAPTPPEAMHDLLYYADCYVGDSATMATEAAVLGTPAVRFDMYGAGMGNFRELTEAYDLVRSTTNEEELLATVADLLSDPDRVAAWQRRRRRLLAEKIDVTAFMLDLIPAVAAGNPLPDPSTYAPATAPVSDGGGERP